MFVTKKKRVFVLLSLYTFPDLLKFAPNTFDCRYYSMELKFKGIVTYFVHRAVHGIPLVGVSPHQKSSPI